MIVVDTSAIVAILKEEPEASAVADCIGTVSARLFSAGSMMECHLVIGSRYGEAGRRALTELVKKLTLDVVPFDEAQARIGIRAYRRYGRGSGHPARLNFGDCFSYALAKSRGFPLLFKGDDFVHTDIDPALKPT